ncbi:MAG: cytochrome c oxidase assembly protein [Bauldia sp.]|nr:cytochrome c oxidase assembly protein [Bauldia sp.]
MTLVVLLALAPASAAAHGGGEIIFPAEVLSHWHPDPLPLLLALGVVALYGIGLTRLWRRAGVGRGVRGWQAGLFAGGVLLFLFALASPLESVTGTLLTAHMIQHVTLVAAAPALVLLGRPDIVLLWTIPQRWRHGTAAALSTAANVLRPLVRPVPAALIHGAVIWAWHAPPLFEAALASDLVHDLEHATFVATAFLFWQAIFLAMRRSAWRLAGLVAIVLTVIQSGLLGALLTLSNRVLYPAYGDGPLAWNLTALADQQLAGLVMWVPAAAAYLAAGVALGAAILGFTGMPRPQRLT